MTPSETLKLLDWHYGPTETDKDPGKMWCRDCKAEVWTFDGVYMCTKCSATDPAEEQQ